MTPAPSPSDLARALFHGARDAVLLIGPDGRVVDANPAALALIGRPGDALIGSATNDLLDGSHLLTATGEQVPVCAHAVQLGGPVPLTALTLRDLRALNDSHERVEKAEAQIRVAEARYRNALEGSLQGILIHQDERIRYANPALARMFGYDGPGELIGRHLWETFAPPEHVSVLRARTAALYAGEPVPPHPGWRAIGKDGRRLWVTTSASRIEWDGRPAIVSYYLDISEQKRAEEALQESERFVRAITGASPHTMYVFDRVEGRNIWANRHITDDLGYTPEQVRDMGPDFLARLAHPDDLARLPALLARWDTAGDDEVLETEYRMRHADGSWRWFVGHDTVFARDADGRVRQFLGTTQDVTDRKRAEQALRESEALYASLVAALPIYLFRKDRDGRFVFGNERFCELVGMPAERLLGHRDVEFLPPDLAAGFRADDLKVMESGQPLEQEERNRDRHGNPVRVHVIKTPVRAPDGTVVGVQAVFWDITARQRAEEERRQLEARVLQAQKLESLGVLAGGIAHDFNNLLTSVLGYSSLAALDLPAGSKTRAMIGEIEKAAQRAADLTGQMLAYSGRGKFVVQTVGLDALVYEMHNLLQTVVSKKAVIRLELAPAAVLADATQIRQVVMNLLTNASDALNGEQGAIAVRTGTRLLGARDLMSPFVQDTPPPGEYAFLEIEDTGCGMPEETLARIFDPFFTTKFTGRGLGLAAVLGIIRGHKGGLQIDTAPGRGTTFRIFLPGAALSPLQPAAPPPAAPPRGSGRVLVVDDEENVRTLASRVLSLAGFEVLTAPDGSEALRVLRERRGTVRAVLLDVTMPQLDGWEVAARLRAEEPNLPVMMMSGYSDAESRREAPANVVGFLPKPFRAGELLDLVCRVAR